MKTYCQALYRLCGAFFEEKLGLGVSPNCARKMGLAVYTSEGEEEYTMFKISGFSTPCMLAPGRGV
jgi:hypothetical protein